MANVRLLMILKNFSKFLTVFYPLKSQIVLCLFETLILFETVSRSIHSHFYLTPSLYFQQKKESQSQQAPSFLATPGHTLRV